MSVPAAGRRKGLAPAGPSSSPPPPSVTDSLPGGGGPSWLDVDEPLGTATVSAAPASKAPSLTASALPSQSPSQAPGVSGSPTGPLSFLEEDDGAEESYRLVRVGRRTVQDAAVRGFDALPEDLPAFLIGEGGLTEVGPSPAELVHRQQPQPQPQPQPPADDALHRRALMAQWDALQAELQSVQDETTTCTAAVAAFTSGTHELCKEVAELRSRYEELRERECTVAEAKAQLRVSHPTTTERPAGSPQQTLEEAVQCVREELEAAYRRQLAGAREQLAAQEAAVDAVRASAQQEVDDTTASNQRHALALDRLQSALVAMVQGVRTDLAGGARRVLAASIREEMASAACQRADIFAVDRKEREDALARFLAQREEAARVFRESHAATLRAKYDAAMGAVQQSLRAEHGRRAAEGERRLGAQRAQVGEALTAMGKATQTAIEELVRRTERDAQALADRQAAELKAAREHKIAQHRLFRQRADTERQNFETTAAQRRLEQQQQQHVQHAVGSPESLSAAARQQFAAAVEGLRGRLAQLRSAASAERTALQQRSSTRTGALARLAQQQRQLEDDMQRGSAAGAQAVERAVTHLRRTATAVQTTTKSTEQMLRDRRARLTALHDDLASAQCGWAAAVTRSLASPLTMSTDMAGEEALVGAASAMVSRDSLVTESLAATAVALERVSEARQAAQHARRGQSAQLGARVQEWAAQQRQHTAALQLVFEGYEKLHRTGAAVEGLQRVADLTSADLDAARAAVAHDRAELADRGRALADAAARLQKQSRRLDREERRLRAQWARAWRDGAGTRAVLATQAPFLGGSSALADVAVNRPHSDGAVADSHRAACRADRPAGTTTPSPVPVAPSPREGSALATSPQSQSQAPPKHERQLSSLLSQQQQQQQQRRGTRPLADRSPLSSLRTASDFSTELIPLDDDSMEDVASLQAALGLDSGLDAALLSATRTWLGGAGVEGSGAQQRWSGSSREPQAGERAQLTRSLTTPSSFSYKS